jgi:hypothetical protein
MPKYKILKQQYTSLDNVPDSIRERIWVGKLNDNDTLNMFDFYAEAKSFADQLKQNHPERNYKVVEISGNIDVKNMEEETLHAVQEQTELLNKIVKILGPTS